LFHDSNGTPAPPQSREPEAEYVYTDEAGNEVERKIRYPGKRFKTVRKKYPYRAQELMRECIREVYVVEGEKDVHFLQDHGVHATTGGAADVWEDWWSERYFRDRDVVIVADKDAPGLEHAKKVALSLEPYARSIKIVEALIGKDAADHLQLFRPDQFRLVMEVK
jgi:DNA primase